ncbi:hypothetical protein BJY21_000062 [Kineosphaera limosa]|uniref:LemA family protein n=1 Tax=Kineosphaera limosa NBRC 100340 TaxID=1184609 RepID=K6VF63_9MICO|nr:hypothetical protein [Kineosphaera limosa]NYD98877.1 hypothetical protein [Kineosphaera limosa]GAB94798.1 hypothetical protein KILIM_011_00710 [Kineosphaera limosa NBRC 100340]
MALPITTLEAVTLTAVVVLLLAWYLTYTAARLHRLHTRVEGSLAALDAQLVRRAEAAVELSNAQVLDPATSLLLASAASDCLDSAADELTNRDWAEGQLAQREALESDLTVTIRHALAFLDQPQAESQAESRAEPRALSRAPGPATTPAAEEDAVRRLRDAHRRAQLARRFYNDAVSDVQRLRATPMVRTFRLAGHAALPRTVEFDDDA